MKLYPLALTLVPYFPVGPSYNSYLAHDDFPSAGHRCMLRFATFIKSPVYPHRVSERLRSANSTPILGKSRGGTSACRYPAAICRSISMILTNFHTYAHVVYISAKYTIFLSLRIFNWMAARMTRCMHYCVDCGKK